MTKKEIEKYAIIILLSLIVLFGLLDYTLSPQLSDFRNSIYGIIINFLILDGIILYLTISRKINMPLLGKFTVWGFGLLLILTAIFNFGKIEELFFLIYAIFNIIVTVYLYKKTGIGYKSIWGFGAFSYLSTMAFVFRAEYINGDLCLTFLIPAILISVVAFIPCLIYGVREFKLYRDVEKLICVPLLGVLGGFALTWLTVLSMNVYLDTSTPTYEEYVIIDKDIRAGARQITTYELEVKNGDTVFTIGVSETAYYSYEINDPIRLSVYNGAFNEPYYIHENNSD